MIDPEEEFYQIMVIAARMLPMKDSFSKYIGIDMTSDQFDLFMMLIVKMIAMYDIKMRHPEDKGRIDQMMRELLLEHDRVKAEICDDWSHLI